MNNIYGVILAGGSGSRMKTPTPKQFMKIGGLSLLEHSVKKFKSWGFFKSIVIVSNPDYILETEKILSPYLDQNDRIIEGGETRHGSSLNAINSIQYDDNDVIIFHDSARPYFLNSELHEIANSSVMYGVSSIAENVTDTVVFSANSKVEKILDRDSIYLIKTPQGIHTSILKNLLHDKKNSAPTDLCSWAKQVGVEAYLIHSNPFNIKVTKEGDLEIAERYFELFKKLEAN